MIGKTVGYADEFGDGVLAITDRAIIDGRYVSNLLGSEWVKYGIYAGCGIVSSMFYNRFPKTSRDWRAFRRMKRSEPTSLHKGNGF